ncbi:hypothetical protein ACIQI8_21300 [Streptomyces sp. NPDC092369]|uniref:hypothetical protein n=1 Tax=Streptomyces sp. NPDC092369 TaxID=3366015 RepID=UPI0037FCEA54
MTDTEVRADGETEETQETGGGTPVFGPRLFGSTGRHRRPRPRKVLFAAGGIALAAGVLSLVRLAPESGVGGIGAAEAEPGQQLPDIGTDRATNAAATLAASPVPSATSVLGGESATPTGVPVPTATTSPTALPGARVTPGPTTIPEAPNAPTTAPRAPAPATTAPAPQPTPTATQPPPPAPAPSHTTAPRPAPQPTHDPGLCVPIVGVCVGLLHR